MNYIAIADRMHTDWRGYLSTPLEIVEDYLIVMQGEALAMERAKSGKQSRISDAPPGFELDVAEPETIEYHVPRS